MSFEVVWFTCRQCGDRNAARKGDRSLVDRLCLQCYTNLGGEA